MKKSLLTLVSAAALAIAGSGIANASITVALTSDVAGVFTYGISVDSLESVNSTSYFTIYDFAGYESGTIFAPAGWTSSAALVGKTPSTVIVPDSGSLYNLTFSYVGPPTSLPGGTVVNGFGADSTAPSEVVGWFSYQAIKTSLATIDQGDGNLEVPTGTPEPMTMSLVGGGLALLGMLRFRSKKS
jgi:hypothetical protein